MKTLHFLHKYSIEVLTLHFHQNKIKFFSFKHHKHPSLDKMIKKNEYHNLLKIITNFNSSPFLHNLNILTRTEHYIIKDKRTTHYFTFQYSSFFSIFLCETMVMMICQFRVVTMHLQSLQVIGHVSTQRNLCTMHTMGLYILCVLFVATVAFTLQKTGHPYDPCPLDCNSNSELAYFGRFLHFSLNTSSIFQ